ncbi:MAG: lanthionine synthetase LanC family protein [Thermoplasmatota archaeon]
MNETFLEEAKAIGDRFVSDAIEAGDMVTWISRDLQEAPAPTRPQPLAKAMGPSIYSGTSGVALFLSSLGGMTGEKSYHQAAVKAIQHALFHVQRTPSNAAGSGAAQGSFYSGGLGVACVAIQIGTLTAQAQLVEEGHSLLRRIHAEPTDARLTDLLGVHGSAILTFLDLQRADPDNAESHLETATRFGDALDELALEKDGQVWWRPSDGRNHFKGLTGFSHGAAGYALAMLKLHEATGKERFRELGLGSLEYERASFREDLSNWPDFRSPPASPDNYPCSTMWCHGAAGIGYGRSLMVQAGLADNKVPAEIEAALATTMRFDERSAEFPGQNMMLCHGVFGNLECQWAMRRALGHEDADDQIKAQAQRMIDRYGHEQRERSSWIDWPTGHTGYSELSMMKGLAGVGHTLLRLHAPDAVPDVLVPNSLANP